MKCVTPMIRIVNKGYPDDYKIISTKGVARNLKADPNYLRKITKWNDLSKYEVQEIPCGHCYACRLSYAADWATRLMLEKTYYPDDECWFVTLTYDDEHLVTPEEYEYTEPLTKYMLAHDIKPKTTIYKNDGTWNGTLIPEHVQTFIRDLRYMYKDNPRKIRYYLCGEYGTETLRPHYHLIIFGAPFKDLYDCHIDKNFKECWKAQEIDKLWKYGTITQACHVEWSNCGYVARYCMKKVGDTWSIKEWAKLGKSPEFVRMSRDIGFRYYEDHKDEIWATDSIIMKTVKGNIGSTKPPKAFMRKLEKEDIGKSQRIKMRRKWLAEKSTERQRLDTDYTDLEELIIKADELANKSKQLKREI